MLLPAEEPGLWERALPVRPNGKDPGEFIRDHLQERQTEGRDYGPDPEFLCPKYATLEPVNLFRTITQFRDLDCLADISGALEHRLGNVAGQGRILAVLLCDNLLGYLQEFLSGVGLEVEGDEPGEKLWRKLFTPVDAGRPRWSSG